jgi:3-oxoacid CoA-transferase subunit A
MKKFSSSISDTLATLVFDGMTIMVGGFGLCGIPETCIKVIKETGVKDLTIISNNCGIDDFGLGILLQAGQIKKMISSYVGENNLFAEQLLSGKLAAELIPQGTLAERIRAAGAGIPAFFTHTGIGTIVAEGKEIRVFKDKEYILEQALTADLALVKAWKGDYEGNLQYRKTARNFNPLMAMAGKVTVAEVEEIYPIGELDTDNIHTPGIFVDHIFVGQQEKRIEKLILAA